MNRNQCLAAALIASALLARPASCQMGQGRMPAAMQAKVKAWQTWRKSHRNIGTLEKTIRGLSMLEQDPATRLSKSQAKATVAVLKAWRHKPKMTDAQAKQVNTKLTASFTVAQLNKLMLASKGMGGGPGGGPGMAPPNGGPRPGGMAGPPPGGRPGGAPGMPRGAGAGAFPSPREYNPLNPDSLPFPPERDRVKHDLDRLMSVLSKRAQ